MEGHLRLIAWYSRVTESGSFFYQLDNRFVQDHEAEKVQIAEAGQWQMVATRQPGSGCGSANRLLRPLTKLGVGHPVYHVDQLVKFMVLLPD